MFERPTISPHPRPSVSKTWLRALETASRLTREGTRTFAALLDELGDTHGDAPALLSDTEQFSFEQLAARSRMYTRWAVSIGLSKGDGVALLMPNRPEYFAIWVGISRMGAVVSLINTNLRDAALAHCIGVASAKHLIVEGSLAAALASATPHLEARPAVWGADQIDLSGMSEEPFAEDAFADVLQADTALHIYTSGTTGPPKAARISHGRILSWSGWFSGLVGAQPNDRLYNCLPMYHSVGGVTAIGAALAGGASVVLRERFSASSFWSDVVRWDCTLFQYIGELCRYLLVAPQTPDEQRHRLRLICGNGLSADVWTAFQARFAIPVVLEFYAATEASFSLYNVEAKPGAIGRIPPFLAHRVSVALIRLDADVEQPVRAGDGRCIACAPDEVGEAIGRISLSARAGPSAFEGYTDKAASERKVLRDVFEPGDAWFRTGDLMHKDAAGFFYFDDRIGDTFRWKGENVASQTIYDVVAQCPGVREAAVYGVRVPHADGRAGMAAIAADEGFSLEPLADRVIKHLPSFARPHFIRLMTRLPLTETFKLKKQELARDGFDIARTSDPIYLLDPTHGSYRRIDPVLYNQLLLGELRL
jgi:fatty-acyl-CoA synthase